MDISSGSIGFLGSTKEMLLKLNKCYVPRLSSCLMMIVYFFIYVVEARLRVFYSLLYFTDRLEIPAELLIYEIEDTAENIEMQKTCTWMRSY